MVSLHILPGTGPRTLLLFHGYGGSQEIADQIRAADVTDATLVSFNFPDHDLTDYDPERATFGTPGELIPALEALTQLIVTEGRRNVDLYGFSAGGGALINLIALLNSDRYQVAHRQELLEVIQQGSILLDAPFKSIEEIIAFRGPSEEFSLMAERYARNRMRPIDSLEGWKGLRLNVIIYFERPDEVLSNRDDSLFVERLRQVNKDGTNTILFGTTGGHNALHPALWSAYRQASKSLSRS